MFERFTEQARQVIVLAQDEARALRHNYIGTEHILLGVLRLEKGRARELLDSLGVTAEDVRAQVVSTVGEGAEVVYGQIRFTPRATRTLELSLREALALGDNYIGPEHLLLGLVAAVGVPGRPGEAEADRIADGVARILSGPPDRITFRGMTATGGVGESSRFVGFWLFARLVAIFGIGVLVGWLIWGH